MFMHNFPDNCCKWLTSSNVIICFVAVLSLCVCKFVVTAGPLSVQRVHIHWNQSLSSVAAPEIVNISTSNAASDINFVKIKILFHCWSLWHNEHMAVVCFILLWLCCQCCVDPCYTCPHILQGCFTGIGHIVWLTRSLWNNLKPLGKVETQLCVSFLAYSVDTVYVIR